MRLDQVRTIVRAGIATASAVLLCAGCTSAHPGGAASPSSEPQSAVASASAERSSSTTSSSSPRTTTTVTEAAAPVTSTQLVAMAKRVGCLSPKYDTASVSA